MSRLVVVLPLVPLRTGESFAVTDWPLHITVLPPFGTHAAPADLVDAIAAGIAAVASPPSAITATAGGDELFGRRHNIPVTVIAENEELARLHRALVEAVRPLAASPNEPAFTGPEFRPHVTTKRHGRIHLGDELSLTQVALVDMAPRSAPGGRSVLATFSLIASPTPGPGATNRR
jgi:2'-5' RNA ligase